MTGSFVHMDFDCITPLGPARCRGMWVAGDVTEWLTDIDATREAWWFRNQDFRFASCVTDRGHEPSQFGEPNANLARQIERYRKNGWLPGSRSITDDLYEWGVRQPDETGEEYERRTGIKVGS
jgi:hypothetical protein